MFMGKEELPFPNGTYPVGGRFNGYGYGNDKINKKSSIKVWDAIFNLQRVIEFECAQLTGRNQSSGFIRD